MTTLSSYLSIARDMTRWRSITAKTPEVTTQTRYFQDNIGKATRADKDQVEAALSRLGPELRPSAE